jgi:hypothetical protein
LPNLEECCIQPLKRDSCAILYGHLRQIEGQSCHQEIHHLSVMAQSYYSFIPWRSLIDISPSIKILKELWIIRSNIASVKVASPTFSYQPCVSNWEQKMVETTWWRDPTISNTSRASFSRSDVRSHPSIIIVIYVELEKHLEV